MTQTKKRNEVRLNQLIAAAKQLNIEVRAEKLLREVGYRARSGRCRIKGQELILIDRDAPLSEQVDFLSAELTERQRESSKPAQRPNNASPA